MKAAGKIILSATGNIDLSVDTISKIGSRDIVTASDINCQIAIKEIISSVFSTHKFLAEGITITTTTCI